MAGSEPGLLAVRLAVQEALSMGTLTVRAADFPHGLRCGECKRLLNDGDPYAESLTGMIGEIPAVMLVCVPCERGWSADEEQLHRRLEQAMARGKVRLMDPLPWRTRLRLGWEHMLNQAGYWLACHGRNDAAVRLWKIFGMWS